MPVAAGRLAHLGQHHRVGDVGLQAHVVVVDLDGAPHLVHPERLRAAAYARVEVPVLVSEHDVVGGERLAVRPLRTLAQGDGEAQEVGRQLEALGQVGHHRGVGPDVGQVAAALGLLLQRVPRLGAVHEHVDGVAVGADRIDRLHHRRLDRQPLDYRRQFSRRHQCREHRRFRVLAADRHRRRGSRRAVAVGAAGCEQAGAHREQSKAQSQCFVHGSSLDPGAGRVDALVLPPNVAKARHGVQLSRPPAAAGKAPSGRVAAHDVSKSSG